MEERLYDAARGAIRDNVKWLVAAFASIGALIVGGSPLAIAQELEFSSGFAWLSGVTTVLAFLCVADGLRIALAVLRPDGIFVSDLRSGRFQSDPELEAVRDEIKSRSVDLLPYGFGSADELINERNATRHRMAEEERLADENPGHNEKTFDDLAKHLDGIDERLARLSDFALYRLLYLRLKNAQLRLFFLGFGTLVLLAVSVASASRAKADPSRTATVLLLGSLGHPMPVEPPALVIPCPEPAPPLGPVLFETGSFDVQAQGMNAIARVRAFLQHNTGCVLLVASHTDTAAGDRVNARLARRRGEEVRALLLRPGGLAENRIFVSELPENSLPLLTRDEVREQRNRSVEFFLATAVTSTAIGR